MGKCECFENRLKRAEENIKSNLPEGACELQVKWNDHSFFFAVDYSPVNPKVNFSFRAKKKNGALAKNATRNSFSMIADFCCFCGRKLSKSNKE